MRIGMTCTACGERFTGTAEQIRPRWQAHYASHALSDFTERTETDEIALAHFDSVCLTCPECEVVA